MNVAVVSVNGISLKSEGQFHRDDDGDWRAIASTRHELPVVPDGSPSERRSVARDSTAPQICVTSRQRSGVIGELHHAAPHSSSERLEYPDRERRLRTVSPESVHRVRRRSQQNFDRGCT